LPSQGIVSYFQKIGLHDDNLQKLYLWKDGFDMFLQKGFCDIFYCGCYSSLAAVSKEIEMFQDSNIWPTGFIPLLDAHDGRFMLFHNENGPNYGKIYYLDPQGTEGPEPFYDSILTFIDTQIACYENNVYALDKKTNMLDIDLDEFDRIRMMLNPISGRR